MFLRIIVQINGLNDQMIKVIIPLVNGLNEKAMMSIVSGINNKSNNYTSTLIYSQ